MRKCYAAAAYFTENNKQQMRAAAEECGFEIEIFNSPEAADGNIADGEVLFSDHAELAKQMPDLRWCHSASAGVGGYIGTGVFDSGDVLLTNSSGAYGLAISEHVIMVTLMLMRRMPEYRQITEERKWLQDLPVRSIAGSRIAIIGTGNIGSMTAERYKALGAKSVIGFSRSGRSSSAFDAVYQISGFDEVIANADASEQIDVLMLCVPGTPESEGLLSAERIGMLPEKAYVINVGRGIVIDQDALVDALNSERIAGAALDVVYPEPLPEESALWTAKNCIITPHTSGDMGLEYSGDRTVGFFCENLRRYAAGGELINLVDVSRGY